MRRRYRSILLVGVLALGGGSLAACHAPVSVQTQAGKNAYTADQVVLRVNELQKAAIQAEATGGLPTATTRLIVQFAVSADTTLKSAPDGWKTTVLNAWLETKRQLPVVLPPAVAAAVTLVDTALALQGGGQ